MTEVVVGALLLVALAAGAWLTSDLRPLGAGAPRGRPAAVSVVVPARDEERTVGLLLASLEGLGLAEVVVVDDGSRDRTAAVAAAAGARVVSPGRPPAGWTGKAWACHVGARATSGDLLLFLDADTQLSSAAVDGLLDLHARHGGLVSVQPFHTVRAAYEQLSAYFNLVAVLGSGAFSRRPPAAPMAFGPCLLTSREDYERAGGHGAVRAEILDDVRLARAYRAAGLPVRCATGGPALRMRSYPGGLRQLVDGWTKNIASGAAAGSPVPTLGAVAWVGADRDCVVGAVLAVPDAPDVSSGPLWFWAVAWLLVALQLRHLLRRLGSFRWWTWALFPLPLLAFDAVFARSVVRTALHRSVRWRGREVDLRRSPAGRGT